MASSSSSSLAPAALYCVVRSGPVNWEQIMLANTSNLAGSTGSEVRLAAAQESQRDYYIKRLTTLAAALFDPTAIKVNPPDHTMKLAGEYASFLHHLREDHFPSARGAVVGLPSGLYRGAQLPITTITEEITLSLYNAAVVLYNAALDELRMVLDVQKGLASTPRGPLLRGAFKKVVTATELLTTPGCGPQYHQETAQGDVILAEHGDFAFVAEAEQLLSFAVKVIKYEFAIQSDALQNNKKRDENLARLAFLAASEALPTSCSTAWREAPLQMYALSQYHLGRYFYTKEDIPDMRMALSYVTASIATLEKTNTFAKQRDDYKDSEREKIDSCVLSLLMPSFGHRLEELAATKAKWERENNVVYHKKLVDPKDYARLPEPQVKEESSPVPRSATALVVPLPFMAKNPFEGLLPTKDMLHQAAEMSRLRAKRTVSLQHSLTNARQELKNISHGLAEAMPSIPKMALTALEELLAILEQRTAGRAQLSDGRVITMCPTAPLVESILQEETDHVRTSLATLRLTAAELDAQAAECIPDYDHRRGESWEFREVENKLGEVEDIITAGKLSEQLPCLGTVENSRGRDMEGLTMEDRRNIALGALTESSGGALSTLLGKMRGLQKEVEYCLASIEEIDRMTDLSTLEKSLERVMQLLKSIPLVVTEAKEYPSEDLHRRAREFVAVCRSAAQSLQASAKALHSVEDLQCALELERGQYTMLRPATTCSLPAFLPTSTPSIAQGGDGEEEPEEGLKKPPGRKGKGKKVKGKKATPKKSKMQHQDEIQEDEEEGTTTPAKKKASIGSGGRGKTPRSESPSRVPGTSYNTTGVDLEMAEDLLGDIPEEEATVPPTFEGDRDLLSIPAINIEPPSSGAGPHEPSPVPLCPPPPPQRIEHRKHQRAAMGSTLLAALQAQAEPRTPEYPPVPSRKKPRY